VALEIERRFVVEASLWPKLYKDRTNAFDIVQGYVGRKSFVGKKSLGQTVRVRIKKAIDTDSEAKAFLTIKGPSPDGDKAIKLEYEYSIPLSDAKEILKPILDAGRGIKKVRAEIVVNGRTWEVDRFSDRNKGLVLAEVEFPPDISRSARQAEILPSFVGMEVTEFSEFSNSSLDENPFTEWSKSTKFAFGL